MLFFSLVIHTESTKRTQYYVLHYCTLQRWNNKKYSMHVLLPCGTQHWTIKTDSISLVVILSPIYYSTLNQQNRFNMYFYSPLYCTALNQQFRLNICCCNSPLYYSALNHQTVVFLPDITQHCESTKWTQYMLFFSLVLISTKSSKQAQYVLFFSLILYSCESINWLVICYSPLCNVITTAALSMFFQCR